MSLGLFGATTSAYIGMWLPHPKLVDCQTTASNNGCAGTKAMWMYNGTAVDLGLLQARKITLNMYGRLDSLVGQVMASWKSIITQNVQVEHLHFCEFSCQDAKENSRDR